jgi:hypothetical protein
MSDRVWDSENVRSDKVDALLTRGMWQVLFGSFTASFWPYLAGEFVIAGVWG